MRRLIRLLRRARAEDGAVIVIVAVVLVCALGAAALAIDLSAGRQAEQRAQAGADAGAAAGADQIDPSNPASTPPATVSTTASDEAVDNGACPACVHVDYPYHGDPTQVGVTISGASDATLGGEFGRKSIPVSASAVAAARDDTSTITSSTSTNITNTTSTTGDQTVTNTVTTTSTSVTHGTNAILFASDTSCSGGITMSGDSGASIAGETFSNGGLHIDKPSDINFGGPVYYQTGCTNSGVSGSHATAPITGWPEDFTGAIAAICGTTHLPTRNIDIENQSNDNLGTGPMCTTGSITIKGNSGLSGTVTFVGNSIDIEGNSGTNIRAYYQDLLFYQTGSGTMNISNGSDYPGGTVFAPNATVLINNDSGLGKNAPGGYIEAKDITITGTSGTTIHGAGTSAAGTTSTSTGLSTSVTVNHTPTTIVGVTPSSSSTTITQTSSAGSSLVQ